MPFEPPGFEPANFEPEGFEPWPGAVLAPGTDPGRHPDPDLTVLVEVGPVAGVLIEV